MALSAHVHADVEDPQAHASEAYARGARAYDLGQYTRAAHELAVADQLAPNLLVLPVCAARRDARGRRGARH